MPHRPGGPSWPSAGDAACTSGWSTLSPGSDLQLALARAFAAAANPGWAADLLQSWLDGVAIPSGLTVDTDLRWLLVSNLSRMGRMDLDAIAAEERRDGTITGSEQAAGARAAIPSAEAKAEAWRLAVTEDGITNTMQSAICLGFWVRGQDELLMPYVERYFRAAEDISALRGGWATKADSLAQERVAVAVPVAAGQAGPAGPAESLARRGVAVQLGAPGDRGAPRRRGPRAALPTGRCWLSSAETSSSFRPSTAPRCSASWAGGASPAWRHYEVRAGMSHYTRTVALPHGPAVIALSWDGSRLELTSRIRTGRRTGGGQDGPPALRPRSRCPGHR